ncbi:MAG TPA: DinB family protein [Armatimonadota bacterium]|nr:DinB family protein [Armatimonadota bacterium]
MRDDLAALFEYNRWADDRIIASIRLLTPEQYTRQPAADCRSVHGTLIHMADATLIWVRRLQGETVSGRIDEATVPTLGAAVQFLDRSHRAVAILQPMLTPEALAGELSYTDLQGQPRALPAYVVPRHLVNHSSYHRGQIAARLIDAGIEPPLLDLALWAMRRG